MPHPKHADTPAEVAAADLELVAAHRRSDSRWSVGEWRAVLARLPARDRRVVVCRVLWGMDWRQIGERVGISYGRAQQLYRRSIDMLWWYTDPEDAA